LRLCWWITTSVVLFSVRCVLELLLRLVFGGVRFAGWSLQNEHHQIPTTTKAPTQRTENKTSDVVIHQHSRKLLKMGILMSETCWAHNKWNKIASDIKLVFHSSRIVEALCVAKRKDGAYWRNRNCWNVNPNVYLYVCNVSDHTVFSNLMSTIFYIFSSFLTRFRRCNLYGLQGMLYFDILNVADCCE
jgi:hypothetical protein